MRLAVGDDGDACYNTEVFITAANAEGARAERPLASPSDVFVGSMRCINIESCTANVDEFSWTSVPVEENGVVTPSFDIKLSVDKPHSKWC